MPSPTGGGRGPARPPVRRFSDDEVSALIRKALQLQESGGQVGSGPAEGLSLEEVQQVAAEVGIEPRFIELAASSMPVDVDRRAHFLAGGPFEWRLRSTVPGEVPEEDRGRLLLAIRDVMGANGEVRDVYGRMEWSHDDGLGPVSVGVTSRDGTTEVDVAARRSGEMGLWHGLVVPLGGIVGGAVIVKSLGLSDLSALGAIAGSGALSYLGSRTMWKYHSARWSKRIRRLTDRVTDAAARVARILPTDEENGNSGP